MPGRAVLRTVLLLWLAQPTLQRGTGYQPQNGGFGQMLMPFKGYGIGKQNANAYQPNTKAQGYGPAAPQPNGNGAKGYGAAQAGNSDKPNGHYKGNGALPAGAPLRNGNGAKPNGPYKGYGAVPAALGNGNGAKPNGPYKGYGTAAASLVNGAKANGYGNGGKHNGYRPAPVANKGQGHKPYGYGASPLTSNDQQAKPISNGGYGSKPNKPGYGAQPLYGGFGTGMRMAPPMATKGRGGYGKGNGFGQADSSFAGYRNKPAAYPQAGAGFGGGYTKGVKAAKPGYGGGPFVPNGQAAKPSAFVPGAGGPNAQGAKPEGYGGATGAKAGYGGFPNKGGIKGPKPGYGGLPTGYGQRLNGYGGYHNGGAKAPKPGYGGVGNGEGDKSNGYGGYPNGGAKAPKPGYGGGVGVGNGEAKNGQGSKSNGYGVPGGVPKIQPGYGPVINGNEKEFKGKSLNHEAPSLPPVTGFIKGVIKPVEPEPTVVIPALPLTKGMPSLVTSWKTPKPQDPVVSQSSPSKPTVPEQSPVILQDNTPNPVPSVPQGQTPAPLLPQANGTNPPARPSPEIPQGSPQKPVASVLFPQENDIKTTTEVQQSVSPESPQGNSPKPEVLHPTTRQGNSPKPTAAPVLPSVLPQTKDTKPVAPVPEIAQMKDPKPVAPEPDVPQDTVPSLAIEPTPARPQMKDCGHGVSGQWTKLPSPGYGSGPWYPNNEGAKASKPGQGYDPKPQQPDYVNPGAGFGFAGLGGMTKGKSGGPGQLPYNGAPIIPAGLDGPSPVEPQTAELGPEVKAGHAYGGPYGAQPMGMGSEGMPQVRYGIGGLIFGGSPMGYGSNPYGKYGNAYAAQPYGSKAAGNYNPFGFNADSNSAPKYRMEGSPYAASASDAKASGKYGPYGGQQFGFPANYGKYGNPSLPFEALGPVTDGRSVDQPALQYEVPVIDGVKSVDHFGDGEVPSQPMAPLVDSVGEGPVSHIKGGVRAEAAPTGSPFTGSAASLGNSAHQPVDTPSDAVTPQHLLTQQNLKGPQLPQANSWTGGEEPKHNLKGFFGNGYHG